MQNVNAQSEEDLALQNIQNSYYTHLSTQGYNPSIEKDGDVSFIREGKTYYLTPYSEYTFEISRYVELKEGQDCVQALYLLNDFHFQRANERALLYDGCELVQIQSFSILNKPNDWKGIMETSMDWLNNGVNTFLDLEEKLDN